MIMKVQIRKRFRDADTQELMIPGRQAEYDLGRAKKLARSGFVLMLEPVPDDIVTPEIGLDNAQDETAPNGHLESEEHEPEQEAEKAEGEPFPEKVEVIEPTKSETHKTPGKRGPKSKK